MLSNKTRKHIVFRTTLFLVVFAMMAAPALATTVNLSSNIKSDTVTVNAGHTLATGANTLDVEAAGGITTSGTGALDATNGTITCAGSFANSATGVFTSTGSSVTFDAGSGTPSINSGGDAFNTLTINASGATYSALTNNISAAAMNVTAGTLDMAALDLSTTGNLTVDGGTLDCDNAACDADIDGNVSVSAGELKAPAAADDTSFKVGGNWSITGTGTFTHSSGRVFLDAGATGKTIVTTSSNADDFYQVSFNNALGGWTASDGMEVLSDFAVSAGAFTAPSGTLEVRGNFTNAGTFTHNSGTVDFNGAAAANQRLEIATSATAGSITFYNLQVANSTGDQTLTLDDLDTVTVNNALTLTGAEAGADDHVISLTSDDGTNTVDFDVAATGTISLDYVAGTRIDSADGLLMIATNATATSCVNWQIGTSGVAFLWDGSTGTTAWATALNWDRGMVPGTDSDVTIPSATWDPLLDQTRTVNALTINTGGVVGLNTYVLTVTGTLSNSGTLNVATAGTPFSAGTLTNNAGSVVNYTGVAGDTDVNVVAGTYDDITFNNTGTNFLLQGNIIANDDLTLTAGILDADSNGATAGGTIYNITTKGNANFSGTFTARTGTVTLFNDAVDEIKTLTTGSNTFNNLTINHTAVTTNTARVSGALDVNGTFTLTDGTLDLATNNVAVNVGGDVSIANGGAVTKATSSNWTFDGSTQSYEDSNATSRNLGVVVVG